MHKFDRSSTAVISYPVETTTGISLIDGAYGGLPPANVSGSIGLTLSKIGILPNE